jgi:trk system potassium uptake protein
MNVNVVARVVAAILVVIGLSMLSAVVVSWLMNDPDRVTLGLLESSIIPVTVGALGWLLLPKDTIIRFREGFGIVTFSWLAAALFGAIPFVLVGNLSIVDAFFETMSGFTTTGASILNDIESLPAGLLYWRSLTQWLGGMGIVVLSLAILPILGVGGMQLYKAEAPGPTTDQLTPRIASSAKILWSIYILLSVVETVLLMLGGMNLFDAWCHTCATLATGGFSTRQQSIKAFDSVYIDAVITLFMFFAGCNFALHLRALAGRPLSYWKDEEFRFYFLTTIFAIVTVGGCLYLSGLYGRNIGQIVRHSSFTAVSILTTTGFCTEDFDNWPIYAKSLLVCLMFIGGCGGSTGGGMKVSRLLLLLKYSIVQIRRCFYPRSLVNVRLNDQRVPDDIMARILGFFFININIFVMVGLTVCALEPGLIGTAGETSALSNSYTAMETAFSSVAATLYNIGPGLAHVGPTMNYEWMAPHTKLILTFTMLIGRLEVFTVLVLFLPIFWRK